MDKQNVLIPGAGGSAGICAIKSLRLGKFQGKIVTTDSEKLSAGLYLADKGYIVPEADDPSFLQEVMRIIGAEQIDIILPTSGFDIVPYSKNKELLEEQGVVVAMSDYDVVEVCRNKLSFYYKLKSKFNLPYTTDNPDMVWVFPCIVKPIWGKGSRDVFICNSKSELEDVLSSHKGLLIQEYLPGVEYTIDVLSDLNGIPLVAVPRERVEIKAGISVKGRVVLDSVIQEVCLSVAQCLGIKGASCMQMKCDGEGVLRITEVNPRMGGATIMATYAGVNFPELIIKMANAEKFEIPELQEITMVRYYEEVIIPRQ